MTRIGLLFGSYGLESLTNVEEGMKRRHNQHQPKVAPTIAAIAGPADCMITETTDPAVGQHHMRSQLRTL